MGQMMRQKTFRMLSVMSNMTHRLAYQLHLLFRITARLTVQASNEAVDMSICKVSAEAHH